jgi:hypothetical protein
MNDVISIEAQDKFVNIPVIANLDAGAVAMKISGAGRGSR